MPVKRYYDRNRFHEKIRKKLGLNKRISYICGYKNI